MPTKRRTLDRPRRRTYTAQIVGLFRELEAVPTRSRNSVAFKARERELMRALGLQNEHRFSMCSVLTRSREPCHPPGAPAWDDWFRVREARNVLLGKGASHAALPSPHLAPPV
jgi:hypothetical protein